MKKTLISLTVFLLCNVASADDFAAVEAKLKAAMASDVRTEREIARDRNRMPVETLRFFGLRDDMRIIELIPGGGWYTKLLAPVMAAKGEYFAALDVGRIEELIAGNPGFQEIKLVTRDAKIYRPAGSRHYVLEFDGLGVENADMVLTFRNYHNFGLHLETTGALEVTSILASDGGPAAIVAVLDHLPFAVVIIGVFAAISLIFSATTYDSASYILASCATRKLMAGEDPDRWHRVFWAMALAVLPLTLMFIGGLKTVQTATLIVSLPLIFVGVLMAISLVRQLRADYG